YFGAVLVATAVTQLAACSADPRNGAVLAHKWSAITFDGLTDVKNYPYDYRQKNNSTGQWDQLLRVISQSTAFGSPDPSGVIWYGWQSAPTALFQDAKYVSVRRTAS